MNCIDNEKDTEDFHITCQNLLIKRERREKSSEIGSQCKGRVNREQKREKKDMKGNLRNKTNY